MTAKTLQPVASFYGGRLLQYKKHNLSNYFSHNKRHKSMHQDYTSLLNLQNSQKYYHQNSLKESLAIQS